MFEIIKEEEKKYKIGKEVINLELIDEAINSFYLRYSFYDKRMKFGVVLNYEDGYGNSYTEEKNLADTNNDSKNELFQFIENQCAIDGKKFKSGDAFFIAMQEACDNIKIDEMGDFVITPENFSLRIKKEAFIEICGYLDNAIDVNYGIHKLEEIFKEVKQNYLNQETISQEIDKENKIKQEHLRLKIF